MTVESISEIIRITRRTDASEVALAAYRQVFELLDGLAESDWEAPTECEGWRVRDMVGHLLGAARANASMRENIRQQLWGVRHRREFGGNPLDALNALQIADNASLDPPQLAAALRDTAPAAVRGRLRTPALMRAVTVPLAMGGSTAAGMPRRVNLGHLVDVIYTRDVWMHTIDIMRATNSAYEIKAPANQRIVADVVAEWARRHGQPVEVILTGPAGGHYRSAGGESSAPIERDAIEFCRIVSGRAAGDGLLATPILF